MLMMRALICAFVNFSNKKAIQFDLHVCIYDINKWHDGMGTGIH